MNDSGVGNGRISSGIEPGTLVRRTIAFVRGHLPAWRDDPSRAPGDSEEHLNAQLSKFLNATARHGDFPMVHFHHEERQTGRRRVDLSALPTQSTWIGPRHHSVYEPFLVMEGKRLPAPSSDREREYVTGNEECSGGIQRFKLGLHGASLVAAAMIGYVQRGNLAEWHATINNWISELGGRRDAGACSWEDNDQLDILKTDQTMCVSECESAHNRVNSATDRIRLSHFWIEMARNG
jgi:hypothetical protein